MSIAQQLSGLEPLSLSKNKNSRLKKTEVFPFVINAIPIKPTNTPKFSCFKNNIESFKITDHKYGFWILKVIVFLVDIGYLIKLLSNH